MTRPFCIPLYMQPMRRNSSIEHCRALPRAQRDQPFGPETVVWKINGHMFAFYTAGGRGVVAWRTSNLARALAVIRKKPPLVGALPDRRRLGGPAVGDPPEVAAPAADRKLQQSCG